MTTFKKFVGVSKTERSYTGAKYVFREQNRLQKEDDKNSSRHWDIYKIIGLPEMGLKKQANEIAKRLKLNRHWVLATLLQSSDPEKSKAVGVSRPIFLIPISNSLPHAGYWDRFYTTLDELKLRNLSRML